MDVLMVLIHWLHLVALALWIGGLAGLTIVLPAGRRVQSDDAALLDPARGRAQAVLWWSVIALLATLAAEIALHALAQAGAAHAAFMTSVRALLFGTRYGVASVARWLLLVASLWTVDELGRAPAASRASLPRQGSRALGIVATAPRRPSPAMAPRGWLRLAVLLAAALLICTVVAGPYGAAPLPLIADVLHLGATMLWLGGTIVIALVVSPFISRVTRVRRPLALLTVLDRFTPVALVSVLVLVLTGLWESTPDPHHAAGLSSALLGHVPALKALVLTIMVAVSAWGLMVLRPRLRRLARRARRDTAAAFKVDDTLTAERRLLWVNPALAVLALLLGALADVFPARTSAVSTAAPLHVPGSVVVRGPMRSAAATIRTPARGGWQPLGPHAIAYALVADPRNPARLYEGTVDGVYRSTDGGARWTEASTGLSGATRSVWSLTFIPDGSLVAATGGGVYRSTDGAAHWRAAGLGTHAIYTLAIHATGHVVLLAGGDGGIFRSDDRTAHWRQVYNTGVAAVTSLAWPAVRPTLVVAGIDPSPYPVAASDDGGVTWHTVTRGLPALPGMMSVAVAPGARDVYAGSMGLGAYELPGLSGAWQGRNDGLPGLKTGDAHIGSFAFDPADPRILYAATDFGVYASTDGGRHWALFGHGLRGDAAVVTSLALVATSHPTLYAATAAGLYRISLATPR